MKKFSAGASCRHCAPTCKLLPTPLKTERVYSYNPGTRTGLTDEEIFVEFKGEINFEIRAKVAETSSKNSMHGRLQDKRK